MDRSDLVDIAIPRRVLNGGLFHVIVWAMKFRSLKGFIVARAVAEIEEHGVWRGRDPTLCFWIYMVSIELRDGKLDEAWDEFTAGLHALTDKGESIHEYWNTFNSMAPRQLPNASTVPILRVLRRSRDMTAEEVIAMILMEPGYPPRPLKRWQTEEYVDMLPSPIVGHPESGERCGICRKVFDDILPEGRAHVRRNTPCGHAFGHRCLVASLSEKNDLCPVCRFTLAT